MNKKFQKLLENAEGRSDYIIAVCVDIRDFTPFCQRVDSYLTGIYIKKVYLKIINGYFKDAIFYKPAGDGLLIAIKCKEEDMKAIAKSTLDSCIRLTEDFGSLCIGEPMINFPTPEKIGIGITRGNACCLHSGGEILDYSGKTLNLASRLMDMARPSGIVLDGAFGLDLFSDEAKGLFSEEMVYVRGIAEEEPIRSYYTTKYTVIADMFKNPIKEPKTKVDPIIMRYGTFKKLTSDQFWITLSKKPFDKSSITFRVGYPNPHLKNRRDFYEYSLDEKCIHHRVQRNEHRVGFDCEPIRKLLEQHEIEDELKADTKITFEIEYIVK